MVAMYLDNCVLWEMTNLRNLQEIYNICLKECHNANIPIKDKNIIDIGIVDCNLVNYFGICISQTKVDDFIIFVRSDLMDESCPINELKETIIHELIHTCDGCWKHTKTWMKYARILNTKYGYELTTSKDKDTVFHKEKPILHRFVCPKCSSIYNMRSENSIPNSYYVCPFCKSYYIKIH